MSTTTICPKCQFPSQGSRIRPHNCAARLAHPENYLPSPRPAAQSSTQVTLAESTEAAPGQAYKTSRGLKTLSIVDLDVLPPTPQAARGLKEMTLPELEAADRGLRAMPERLEKMSGICAVLNGLILTEIKGRLEHKQFTPWLKANYGKTDRTARRYMQIAAAFSQNGHSVRFEPQQLTLALLDDTQSGALDLSHPVVASVEKWADGRSFRQLIEEECSDGRADNPGGFRPNAAALFSWLKEIYPEHPEYLDLLFDELPSEVQKRFKAEGERYSERLPKATREEVEREMSGREWMRSAPQSIAAAHDAHPYHYGSIEEARALEIALADFLTDLRKHIRDSASKGSKGLPAK